MYIWRLQREGNNPKADAVRKHSKGGCVKMQTRGGRGWGAKYAKILQIWYVHGPWLTCWSALKGFPLLLGNSRSSFTTSTTLRMFTCQRVLSYYVEELSEEMELLFHHPIIDIKKENEYKRTANPAFRGQTSLLTVTPFTVTTRLQWHFEQVPIDWFVRKLPLLAMTI